MEVMVEIYTDRMVLVSDGTTRSISPRSSFSSTRLLVGDFRAAQECLKRGLNEIGATGLFKLAKPSLTIIPKELFEGQLSQVEIRVLKELAFASGAKRVEIRHGGKVI